MAYQELTTDEIASETWRQIPSLPNYEVSDLGCVRQRKTNRPLKAYRTHNGYLRIELSRSGKRINKSIHELVMSAFVGSRPGGFQVNHIDGDKVNNHLSNLEYCTPQENTDHAIRIGIRNIAPKGEKCAASKLTEAQIIKIREMVAHGVTQRLVGELFHTTQSNVSRIVSKESWAHI